MNKSDWLNRLQVIRSLADEHNEITSVDIMNELGLGSDNSANTIYRKLKKKYPFEHLPKLVGKRKGKYRQYARQLHEIKNRVGFITLDDIKRVTMYNNANYDTALRCFEAFKIEIPEIQK